MEVKKKLSTPSGNIHDIKYLYVIIAAIKRKEGHVESNTQTFEYLKKMVNDYNNAKASKFGFSFKPKEVNTEVIKHAVTELKSMRLIREENRYLKLTNEGENIASLIEKKDSTELKRNFTKLMLENFSIYEYFLKRIKKVSNGNGVPIPFINSDVFDKCDENSKKIAEKCIDMVNKNCSNLITEPKKLYDLLEDVNIDSIENRTNKINKLQSIIEKFMVSEAFGPNIKSRRTYDFVRSRMTFSELTNYAIFDFDGFPAEVTYLISNFSPIFKQSVKVIYSGGNIFINYPSFDQVRELFKDSIIKAYNNKKDEFGYAKVADVRDMVCKMLKISDDLFDEYLKRLSKEEPQWLSFTYGGAGDKITEKRLPIIFEEPTRELFTLLKIK